MSRELLRFAGCSVAALLAGLSVGLAGPYYRGGKCIESANCANCLTGVLGQPRPDLCTFPPHVVCIVASSDDDQDLRFTHCVQDSDRNEECVVQNLDPPYDQCQGMKMWFCGCVNRNGECGTAGCSCDGDPDVTGGTFTINVVCTDSPADPGDPL